VWYSFPYANKRGLPLLQPDVEKRGKALQFAVLNMFCSQRTCKSTLPAFIFDIILEALMVVRV
jgi:hypothetical protein